MKLLLAMAVAGLLFAALFLLPIGGHTLWQRAQARGLPQSAAHAMSSGTRAAVRWAEEKRAGTPDAPIRKAPRKEVARAPVGEHAQLNEARYRNGEPAPGADARDPAPLAPAAIAPPHAAPPPTAAHDHIVAAPPKEQLSKGDRQGLDQLIAGSTRHHN